MQKSNLLSIVNSKSKHQILEFAREKLNMNNKD